jgi:hypothetical protein
MNIANIDISRVIVHEVVRASQVTARPPILNDELVKLDRKGASLVAKRLIDTVASGSHCVDVTVDDSTVGAPFDHATRMLDAQNAAFIDSSRHLAQALSSAQTAGPIKSGSAIFVQGDCFTDGQKSRFLAIIKADSDQALVKQMTGDNISLSFVSDTLLGESQRLIKIAFFIEEEKSANKNRLPEEFSVRVFDHLMQNSGEGDAAAYFYGTFLKCKLAHNSSRQTKQFYEVTRQFIDELAIPADEKLELRGDLISYLRGNRATIEARSFAKDVLPAGHHDSFIKTCRDSGITKAITKDLELLKGKMRRQSIRFSSKVTIHASPDAFRDSVKIFDTSSDGWTDLKIKGTIESMT